MSSNVSICLAGAFAGVSVNLLVFPLDTLKTRLQSPSFQWTCASRRVLGRNLYQGVGAVVLVAMPSSGVFFSTYEGLKYALGDSGWAILPPPAVHALSSSAAQLLNCAVLAPAEVIKQNAQMLAMHSTPCGPKPEAKKKVPSPTINVLRQLKRHPTSLWRGYTALAARDLPFTALQFPTFEYLKERLVTRRSRLSERGDPAMGVFESAWISALSAGVAGSAAAWVTTPFDVVKTRMMLDAGGKDSFEAKVGSGIALRDDGARRRGQGRRSGLRVGQEVLRVEGVRGLFRGGFVRATFTILGNGLYMGCYEGAKHYLQAGEEAS